MSTDVSAKVYNCYRAALRSLRTKSPGSRDSRTSDRKQAALRIASERFQLRIREVKNIVRAKDAENGITHESPKAYLRDLELRKAWGEALDIIGVDGPCQNCHTTDEDKGIYIRPNFHQYDQTGKMEFARQCYVCFINVFGGVL